MYYITKILLYLQIHYILIIIWYHSEKNNSFHLFIVVAYDLCVCMSIDDTFAHKHHTHFFIDY